MVSRFRPLIKEIGIRNTKDALKQFFCRHNFVYDADYATTDIDSDEDYYCTKCGRNKKMWPYDYK